MLRTSLESTSSQKRKLCTVENNARRAVADASSASGTTANSSSATAKSGTTVRPGANAANEPTGKGEEGVMELRARH